MKEVKLKAKVADVGYGEVTLEFGRTQAEMSFSSNGNIQRKLRLEEEDEVEVTIKKLGGK